MPVVAKDAPLSPDEERLWRALMRIVIILPRVLDRDLVRSTGLTANEYLTLMNLSEAPNRELRMSELAAVAGLSASRMSRLVDDLASRGLVAKRPSEADGRGSVAKLTALGFSKLRAAWPEHLSSVRRRAFDNIDGDGVAQAARALARLAESLDD
jgi:DNA-binding MarR family transcriptional regulator